MSHITFNTNAIDDRAARIARFNDAMNAKAIDLNSTVNAATVMQGVRAKIAPQVRKHMINANDIKVAAVFGVIVFVVACIAFAFGA